MHTLVLLSSLVFPPMDENLHDNVGEGRSLIFTLVKNMFIIIKKGTNDWIERMIGACTIMIWTTNE